MGRQKLKDERAKAVEDWKKQLKHARNNPTPEGFQEEQTLHHSLERQTNGPEPTRADLPAWGKEAEKLNKRELSRESGCGGLMTAEPSVEVVDREEPSFEEVVGPPEFEGTLDGGSRRPSLVVLTEGGQHQPVAEDEDKTGSRSSEDLKGGNDDAKAGSESEVLVEVEAPIFPPRKRREGGKKVSIMVSQEQIQRLFAHEHELFLQHERSQGEVDALQRRLSELEKTGTWQPSYKGEKPASTSNNRRRGKKNKALPIQRHSSRSTLPDVGVASIPLILPPPSSNLDGKSPSSSSARG